MTVLCKAYRMDLQSLCGSELWDEQLKKNPHTEMYVSTFSIFLFSFFGFNLLAIILLSLISLELNSIESSEVLEVKAQVSLV